MPAGLHHAACYSVIDIGTQPQTNPAFNAARKVVLIFEIPDQRIDIEKDGKTHNLPRAISNTFTLSLHDKSLLKPALESWRGRAFTAEELEGFDVTNVAGANCFINVVHKIKDDRTFANIATINPMPSGSTIKKPENPIVVWSFEDQLLGQPVTVPANVPEWIQKKIMDSEEYKASHNPAPQSQPDNNPTGQAFPDDPTDHSMEDDVPF